MATRFKPLELNNPQLFGIGLAGIIGRSDKSNLLDLADRCLDKGKVHLILDLSELSSMGGGGAIILADFQRRLTSAGGEAVFMGAKDVVRRFLEPKFDELPLRFFESVEEAEVGLVGEPVEVVSEVEKPSPKKSSPKKAAEKPAVTKSDEAVCAMNEVLEEFNGPAEETTCHLGRRKDHQYTSLSEAVGALGSWREYKDHSEYAATLRNLLFSHGLADDAHLLVEREDMMEDPDQEWQLPMSCSLVRQLQEVGEPLSMLDIQEDELEEDEICMLEEINPQIILPVNRGGKLAAILLLNRGGEELEYSVAEHFALELLLQVLERGEDSTSPASGETVKGGAAGTAALGHAPESPGSSHDDGSLPENWTLPSMDDDSTAKVLLTLALNLPDADDRPHFWRLFARHSWQALPVRHLAFLGPEMTRPQVMVGHHSHWESLDLSSKKIRKYFKSMQRPVETANIPATFKTTKTLLADCQADWIVSLHLDDEYLGTAILGLDDDFTCEDVQERVNRIFIETTRLLARFDDTNDNADSSLQLVRLLLAQREKRCFGHDKLTQAIVEHVHRLARVMGFPPDQERNLTYGCLLRDIGLIDKDDDLMKPPEEMDPTQWPVFRRHPSDGSKLLESLNLPQTIVDVVHCHHERFNGEGFPRGLEGREIPLAARVVTVVENYVSMVTGTSSHDPIAPQTAARILRDNLGQRYDPDIVGLFLNAILCESDSSGENKPRGKSGKKRVLQKT
ncbi:MAG: HD domain-containing protein [Candidatus Krumholzibacteria bacterium]|nr:HD domain-containing protein [Candidatus Krumholzibacteria bacterium]